MTNLGLQFNEIELDASKIVDWSSFHATFADTFGFPAFLCFPTMTSSKQFEGSK